ncbi:hypothetical protein GCK32_002058 [Trichostrongylus colubriformis]|uniref:Nodal modulator 1 n=1 Tax=Trichostrongylus colubriformis TaxID=6319 RepID=A0AAN8ILB3_TRICO
MTAVLWFALVASVSADIYSCGGFVKSSVPIDYSKIRVKLLTPEGHLKHEEECNPQNGYYMIPVYNKGQYSLKVSAPEGWYFEPEAVDFKLDGVNDPCTKNEDVNFSLTGFSISGVVSGGSGSGPTGLSLTLKQNGKIVDTAKTVDGGKYSFKAVAGKYEVSTGADSSVCIGHGKALVEVTNAPVFVKPDLRIAGYHFTATVTNKARPLPNVRLTLYSEEKPEVSFSVSGFTARGRVVVGKKGISGAEVIVQGKKVTETDANGHYTLQALTEGPIEVTARAPHTQFSTAKSTLTLPNVSIQDVIVEGFDVCGSVEKTPSEAIAARLVLKRVDNADTISIRPGDDGKFCKMVPPAKYTISPADSSSTLTPRSLDIDLTISSVHDLRFTHFKTDAVVLVTCIGTCETLSISLLHGGNVVDTVRGKDEFIFKSIGPGNYRGVLCMERTAYDPHDADLFSSYRRR